MSRILKVAVASIILLATHHIILNPSIESNDEAFFDVSVKNEEVHIPQIETTRVAESKKVVTRGSGKRTLGVFSVSAYCDCEKCCGKTDGITSSGTHVKEGRTIAVDPDVIPIGSKVYIEGVGYRIAEDIGGAIKGNKIDLFFNSHQEALDFGRQKLEVHFVIVD